MSTIFLNRGESLVKLMIKTGLIVDSFTGIWLVENGSLQKVANKEISAKTKNISNTYAVLNFYSKGDYFMGDSDLCIDYIAIEDARVSQVSLVDIDPVQLLYQLDAIEELAYVNSFKLEDETNLQGRISKFLAWASKRLGKQKLAIPELINQTDIGKMVGVTRVTANKKLQEIKKAV